MILRTPFVVYDDIRFLIIGGTHLRDSPHHVFGPQFLVKGLSFSASVSIKLPALF